RAPWRWTAGCRRSRSPTGSPSSSRPPPGTSAAPRSTSRTARTLSTRRDRATLARASVDSDISWSDDDAALSRLRSRARTMGSSPQPRPGTSPPPPTARGRRTRATLIMAAREVFEADGFRDAKIADIAAGARISYGSFYTYFESKEQIFREVVNEVAGEIFVA